MLTTLQPEENCNMANTRANRGCQETRCCCWKENVLNSASGSCKCNPERMRASRALQRGTQFHYLNAVQITKHIFVMIFFIDKHKTRLDLYSIFRPVSDHFHLPIGGLVMAYIISVSLEGSSVIYDHVFGINCCG